MTWGVDPWGVLSWAEIPGAGTPNPLQLAWDADVGRVFLYEVTAFLRGGGGTWDSPWGSDPWGTVPPGIILTGESTFRFSDTGYISTPIDSVANTNFDSAISTGLQLTRTTPPTPDAGRRVTLNLGTFEISNVDGGMDATVRGYAVDGRRVRVLVGLNTYRYDNFTPIFTGRGLDWDNSLSVVGVTVRDEGYRLDKPMQTDIYGGAGGYDGGSDLAGKPRPMAFGQVLNVSAPLIDAANLVYQVHSREIQSVDAVYDRGAALTADLDYGSYALLVAASVTTGHFATCLTKGLIKLGATPSGLVTVDLHGDAHTVYIDTTGPVAKRIIKDFGGLADSDLDIASWSVFQTGMPGTMGWFQSTTAINVSDALNAVLGHCAAWWGPAANGQIQVGFLAVPSSDMVVLDIEEADIIDLQILPPLTGTYPPRFRQRVGYQKLWTTQADQDLAGAVTAARRQYLSQDTRVVSSTDFSVQTSSLLATDPDPLQSLFYNSGDAQTLAGNLLTLYKAYRQTVRVVLDLKGLGAKLSAAVLVTHRRLNNGSATPMLVMDITIMADKRQVELVLWG